MITLMTMFEPCWRADPYRLHHQLRQSGEIFWDEWLQTWVVLSHTKVCELLSDQRLSSERIAGFYDRLPAQAKGDLEPLAQALGDMMVFTDAPRHSALRRLVRSGFTPRQVRQIRAAISHTAENLISKNVDGDAFDIVHDYAKPLTTETIASIAGIPAEFLYLLDDWQGLTHEFFVQSDAQVLRIQSLRRMFDAEMPARRAGTATDAFSRAIAPEIVSADYSDDEIFANFLLLIDAGLSTTTYLISNAAYSLLSDPGQMNLLRADLSMVPSAVQELIRYDNSVQYTTRIATCDLTVGGKHIRAGQSVTLMLGAANHDPDRYPEPDRLDICRTTTGNLSFGYGSHYCLGAALAIAEMEVAIYALLAHTRTITVDSFNAEWLESINFRFLKKLPVRLTRGTLAAHPAPGQPDPGHT